MVQSSNKGVSWYSASDGVDGRTGDNLIFIYQFSGRDEVNVSFGF